MLIKFFGFIVLFCLESCLNDFVDSSLLKNNSKIDLQNNHEYFETNKKLNHSRRFVKGNNIVASKQKHEELDWWQKCIIYQVYPRSFKDSNGDGVGDIRGIIEKIPYFKYLGVGAVWFNPMYPSPGIDSNYDITDFKQIDKLFGSMHDFDELVKKLHENGIKIILDYVPNHTSDKHEWFIKSIQKEEPYKDYYVWEDAKYINGSRTPPNNWRPLSMFGSKDSMWEWNEQRQQYYLHQFHYQMPDLNYRCPLVRDDMKSVLRFWLDKGVDGFRVDAVTHIYERSDLRDAPLIPETNRLQTEGYTACLDETYKEVMGWRSLLDEYKEKYGSETKLMIVETYSKLEYFMKYYGNSTHPIAHFPLNAVLSNTKHKPAKFYVDLLSTWMSALPSKAWPNWVIGNHDMIRPATSFGNELIDGMNMIQLLLPGTPVIYMADELGMTNTYLRDDQIIGDDKNRARDNQRTPFQWDSSPQAGFSNKTKT